MPSRYINSDILLDGTIRKLSPEAFRLWVLLLAATDEFGIVKASPDDLEKLAECSHKKTSNYFQSHEIEVFYSQLIQELIDRDFGKLIQYSGRLFFIFKPDSFDRYQYHLRNKRKISKALGVEEPEASELRKQLFESDSHEKTSNYFHSHEKTSLARANSLQHSNKQEYLINNSEQEGRGIKKRGRPKKSKPEQPATIPPELNTHPSPTGHHDLQSSPVHGGTERGPAETIPDAVIAILHDVGHRTGIPEYSKISAVSWTPDLRKKGEEIGYKCLLKQAERFQQHMLDKHESGELSKIKKHNPRAKFLNTWLGRVYDSEKTTGDTEQLPKPLREEQPQTKPGEITGL